MRTEEILNQTSFPVKDNETLVAILDDRVRNNPYGTLFEYKKDDGSWTSASAKEFQDRVVAIAKGLIAKGVKPKAHVGIIAHTSYDWICLDYALWMAGAISIPVYETSSPEQIKYILKETDVSMVFVENEGIRESVEFVEKQLPKLKRILVFAEGATQELAAAGVMVSDEELDKHRHSLTADDIATIVFTSGSTGKPKGVILTHRAILTCARNARKVLPEVICATDTRLLMFLPLAHIFARYLIPAVMNADYSVIGIVSSMKNLIKDVGHLKPSFLLGVPRVFEKVYNAASQKASSGVAGVVFKRAVKTAIKYSRAQQDEGTPIPLSLALKHKIYDALVYKQIRDVLGGAIKYAVSGGAPLNKSTAHFFNGAGIIMLEGFGLTETAAPIVVSRPEFMNIGSVGLPFPDVKIRVADDSELLVKSPSLFSGYLHDKRATDEAIDKDGWFHTGDIGEVDAEGFVYITGRKKNILVTSGGKNVAPEVLQDPIEKDIIVDSAVVLGDKKPFIAALITLDAEMLPKWLKERNLPQDMSLADAAKNDVVIAHITRVIAKANKSVSRAESIRKFEILPEQFSEENNTLTPSQKVSRPEVLRVYGKLIEDEIYNTK
jgi:long-chain acyl-CoA synthetase